MRRGYWYRQRERERERELRITGRKLDFRIKVESKMEWVGRRGFHQSGSEEAPMAGCY
jgi:hypothetical protein